MQDNYSLWRDNHDESRGRKEKKVPDLQERLIGSIYNIFTQYSIPSFTIHSDLISYLHYIFDSIQLNISCMMLLSLLFDIRSLHLYLVRV